tara:strand:+ start:2574 stop:3452 length:879 start_codon:yes stop_codon:yes gene_type:complete
MKRLLGEQYNLTNDAILQNFKFTNTYRASDRVSQYLIKNVIYSKRFSVIDTVFRILLFKLFNKIDTWELLERTFGEITTETYSSVRYTQVLDNAMDNGIRIYSNAYMMASGSKAFPVKRKHHAHFLLLDKMLNDALPQKLESSSSMEAAYNLILSYPMIGSFLAYQYVTDINYSEVTSFSECEFTVPGPGAKDGIRKCFENKAGYSDSDIIKLMTEKQEYEFNRLGLDFKYLGKRTLQYIDIQNVFCETDKYCRVFHPELEGYSGRTRIKQKFKINYKPIELFYPPKWNIRM